MTQATQTQQRGILLSESALRQVKSLQDKQGQDLCLRVGVRQGGCSGMSYMMDFEDVSKITPDDEVFDYDGFKIISDRIFKGEPNQCRCTSFFANIFSN